MRPGQSPYNPGVGFLKFEVEVKLEGLLTFALEHQELSISTAGEKVVVTLAKFHLDYRQVLAS